MKLMLITNAPDIAHHAVSSGVDTIFVDLEKMGKEARQGHVNTVKSNHSIADIAAVRAAIGSNELLVRTNPLHQKSREEIDAAIDAGADCLMLPMFETAADVEQYCELVAGRAKVCPLIETPEALADHAALARIAAVDSYHFGLNDLHIAYGNTFIFEPLVEGKLDAAIASLSTAGISFGIGGVARCDEGVVSGRMVLQEITRRGARAVILSRTFHRGAETLDQMISRVDLAEEIATLRAVCRDVESWGAEDWTKSRVSFDFAVRRSVKDIMAAGDVRS